MIDERYKNQLLWRYELFTNQHKAFACQRKFLSQQKCSTIKGNEYYVGQVVTNTAAGHEISKVFLVFLTLQFSVMG